MKRYLILTFFGGVAFISLFVSFQKSESILTLKHQSTLDVFFSARQIEDELDRNVLKSRSFLLLTYDTMAGAGREVEKICVDLKSGELGLFHALDPVLDQNINNYCTAFEKKIEHIELFKSKNAVFKNSVYYLQQIATEENAESTTKEQKADTQLQVKLIKLSLAYSLIANEATKKELAATISKFDALSEAATASSESLSSIALHANTILKIKETIDTLTDEIIYSESSSLLEKVRNSYFIDYAKSESTASQFRMFLFILCAVFLSFLLFNIIQLWKSALKLAEANENLEHKVRERTQDLEESKKKIIQQQQSLISSAKMSSLGEMAGGIAHEINTPLAIISLRAEQLEEGLTDGSIGNEEILHILEVIKKTAGRIGKIISGLRFFARDGKGLPTQEVSLVHLVQETFSFCSEKFSSHGVQLEIKDNCGNGAEVDCRSIEISQVILNLLNNSFDAVCENEEKWIRVELTDRQDFIEISVVDSGKGISSEIIEKIMQPFFTTKEIGKGTGLGLSLSKGIVESHQGKFYVDTNVPNTCFTLLLPKKATEVWTEAA